MARNFTAKKSHNEANKASHSKKNSHHLTAKKSHNKKTSRQRRLTAKKSNSTKKYCTFLHESFAWRSWSCSFWRRLHESFVFTSSACRFWRTSRMNIDIADARHQMFCNTKRASDDGWARSAEGRLRKCSCVSCGYRCILLAARVTCSLKVWSCR